MVSVIIPVYNGADFLEECLRSVMTQSYRDLEIIVIDDGSTDDSLVICKRLVQEDPRIRVIQQQNAGVSAARNKGLDAAKGEYIAFVDADDLLLAGAFDDLPLQTDLIIFDAIMRKGKSGVRYLNAMRNAVGRVDSFDLEANIILWGALGFVWGNLYRRDFLQCNNIRFDEEIIQCEDNQFNYQVIAGKPTAVHINKPIYQYNYCSSSSLGRWRQYPDTMIKNSADRYRKRLEYAKNTFPECYDEFCRKLMNGRVHSIYYNALDLCSAGEVTPQRKTKLRELMSEVELSESANHTTRMRYYCVVKERWLGIRIVALARVLYHKIMKI